MEVEVEAWEVRVSGGNAEKGQLDSADNRKVGLL